MSYATTANPKRILFKATGPGGVRGIVVPRHMWEGNPGQRVLGMKHINAARARVYGAEHRAPLNVAQVADVHHGVLKEHFAKPLAEQLTAEREALARLQAARHISPGAHTLDTSEKLDTVHHEHDEHGRSYEAYASKGVAGHALYTSGHGEGERHHILNTCPGQTAGCSGGVSAAGIVDTSKGTCFAPNAEAQYVNASVRRAAHEQAKHDPAMTKDWILAHAGSLRAVAARADRKNKRTLFRPNVVDETDRSSRHVIAHLNAQRRVAGLPPIVANSYGKTGELHDPENGYYVTHSNVGPKVKAGREIAENVSRDKQRVHNTVLAVDAHGKDFVNEQGHKTPPKNSYLVTDVHRGSPLDARMQAAIGHAKYWSAGRPATPKDAPESHIGVTATGEHVPTTPDLAHYGHVTHNGRVYEYQKQHILHPRLVQVGHNDDGTPHMIPTDSRFKDDDFLPARRFKTRNGKNAGAILMTTPTTSTSDVLHQSSFTHHVDDHHVAHAQAHGGEYEIDPPHAQEAARGHAYVAPQPMVFRKKRAAGGGVDDDEPVGSTEFPERDAHAQAHVLHRDGPDQGVARLPAEADGVAKAIALGKRLGVI